MTYAAAEALLMALPRFTDAGAAAYQPGLDRMRRLLAAVGDPHRAVPVLHVAGTNGKGSTASFAAALLTASGRKTGLHTSPHLWHLAERLRLDGVPAPEAWLADAVGRCAPHFTAEGPSFFEATVLLAFLYFAEAGADAAVIEVGLGGRLDATNVVENPRAALVAALALDHTDLLGPTLADIAREKAGIFKPDAPALTRDQPPDALAVLRARAATVGAPFEVVTDTVRIEGGSGGLTITTPLARYDGVRLGLGGSHQEGNAALALRGVEGFTGGPLHPAVVRRGLGEVAALAGLRARLETVHERPRVVVDVAHNPHGIAAALAATAPPPGARRTILLGLMADKDADAVAALVAASGARVHPVPLGVPRALPADALAHRLRAAGADVGPPTTVPEGVARFVAEAGPDDVLLAVGSFLVAAAYAPAAEAQAR